MVPADAVAFVRFRGGADLAADAIYSARANADAELAWCVAGPYWPSQACQIASNCGSDSLLMMVPDESCLHRKRIPLK